MNDQNNLLVSIENGIIDFNGLINRVKELEERINAINEAVTQLDKEIVYLIDQDNKTSEVLINHANVVKSLREHIEEIKKVTQAPMPKKLHISCKLVDE